MSLSVSLVLKGHFSESLVCVGLSAYGPARGDTQGYAWAVARPVQTGGAAPDAMVLDGSGREIRLSRYWRERPAVLAFLRHFG
jgi:hypothetical protein